MRRVWLIGTITIAGAFFLPACFAYDWDYGGSGGNGETGGAGGNSSSGGPITENCTNGVDDDNDGRIDCVDTDCMSGYECGVAVPAGWNPYWLLEKSFQDPNATSCPDGKAAMVLYAEPATTTNCSVCSCSFTGATCTAPQFGCNYTSPDCMTFNSLYKSNGTPACYVMTGIQNASYGSCKLTGPATPINKGMCSGTSSTVTGPDKFAVELRLCATPADAGGGCGSGDVCTTKKPGTFGQGRACIEQVGTVACPDGWGAKNFAAFESGTDTRQCSDCSCDANSVTCSGGDVTVYFQNNCSSSPGYKLTDPTTCTNGILFEYVSGASAAFTLGTPNPGPCTQAVPSGTVQGMGPHTICCRD